MHRVAAGTPLSPVPSLKTYRLLHGHRGYSAKYIVLKYTTLDVPSHLILKTKPIA